MKRIHSFLFTFALLLAFCIPVFTGCASKEDEAKSVFADKEDVKEPVELTPVTLNEVAHSIFYAPMYAAIENGYFADNGIELTLVNGAGADNVMTALISGDADIGFMGSEASIYVYNEGMEDYVVNFAQLTQRAGNFLVAKEETDSFRWDDLKGKKVLAGRAGVGRLSM